MDKIERKVFISYSWAVKKRVKELADRMIKDGIEVIIDIYDLKEGQDKYAFMEQSVNDPSIDRVLIICDRTYAEKADNRLGGVGDETVIISPKIYNDIKQTKFIPIIFEVDESGKPYCPAYLESKYYIDLSQNGDNYESGYKQLIRNIYEQFLYIKPELGKKPDWLDDNSSSFINITTK